MELWYPAAKRSLTFAGSGSYVFGPYRGVLHTTEGDSLSGALATYKKTGNYGHFTLDDDTVEQHCAINVGVTTLEHPAGTLDTNRASAIQIEIVGRAALTSAFSPRKLERLANLMRWIEEQTGIDFYSHAQFKPQGGATRMTAAQWRSFNSWCGHEHVPNQPSGHWDPGSFDIKKVAPLGFPKYTPTAVYGAVTELGDNVHKQDLTTLPLDENGNGYIDTHIPWDSFLGVILKGLHPARDGWDNKDWNKPRWDANNTDGQATVVFTGGTPGKPVYFQALSA